MNLKPLLNRCRTAGRRALGNQRGLWDISSIMVGAIILAVGALVVAAAVFIIIPWAQDMAAKNSMGSIETGQGVFYSQSATGVPQYATLSDLVDAGFINITDVVREFGETNGQTIKIAADRDQWAAAVLSGSGEVVIATNYNTEARNVGEVGLTAALNLAMEESNKALPGGGGLDGALTAAKQKDPNLANVAP